MVYPGAGVAASTGSAWTTSYTVGTAAGNLVQLNASGQLPAVSGALLTNLPGGGSALVEKSANVTNPTAGPPADYDNEIDYFFESSTFVAAWGLCNNGTSATLELQMCNGSATSCTPFTAATTLTSGTGAAIIPTSTAFTAGSSLMVTFTAVSGPVTDCSVHWKRTVP